MRIFEEGNYGALVREKGRYFLGRLNEIQRKHPEVGDVDGLGLALRMEICEADGFTPNRRLADRMFQLGLTGELQLGSATKGLILDIGGYYKNVITLAPSLEISPSEINEAILALDSVITQAKSTES